MEYEISFPTRASLIGFQRSDFYLSASVGSVEPYRVRLHYEGPVQDVYAAAHAAEEIRHLVQEKIEAPPGGFRPKHRPKWRTGRKVGRTIYILKGEDPSDEDVLIGIMDSPSLAGELVVAANAGYWRIGK